MTLGQKNEETKITPQSRKRLPFKIEVFVREGFLKNAYEMNLL
jgi:hypothetical protein